MKKIMVLCLAVFLMASCEKKDAQEARSPQQISNFMEAEDVICGNIRFSESVTRLTVSGALKGSVHLTV